MQQVKENLIRFTQTFPVCFNATWFSSIQVTDKSRRSSFRSAGYASFFSYSLFRDTINYHHIAFRLFYFIEKVFKCAQEGRFGEVLSCALKQSMQCAARHAFGQFFNDSPMLVHKLHKTRCIIYITKDIKWLAASCFIPLFFRRLS